MPDRCPFDLTRRCAALVLRLALAASEFFLAHAAHSAILGRAGSLQRWHCPIAFRFSYRALFACWISPMRRSAASACSHCSHQARPKNVSRGLHDPQRAQSLVGAIIPHILPNPLSIQVATNTDARW